MPEWPIRSWMELREILKKVVLLGDGLDGIF
jgi:hypothetical protein